MTKTRLVNGSREASANAKPQRAAPAAPRWSRPGLRLPSRVNTADRSVAVVRSQGRSERKRAALGVVTEGDGEGRHGGRL